MNVGFGHQRNTFRGTHHYLEHEMDRRDADQPSQHVLSVIERLTM